MAKNEKHWIKNARERSNLCLRLVFIAKLQVRVLVFSVSNVSELRVDVYKKLEETMHVHVRYLSQDSTSDLFQFLSKFFPQNLSCQTRGAAYLRVRLICRCLWYTLFWRFKNNYYTIMMYLPNLALSEITLNCLRNSIWSVRSVP